MLMLYVLFAACHALDLSRRSWSPAVSGPPGPSMAIFVAVHGPPDQVWLPQMVPFALHRISSISMQLDGLQLGLLNTQTIATATN